MIKMIMRTRWILIFEKIFSILIFCFSILSFISCITCSKFIFFKKQITSIWSFGLFVSNILGNLLLEVFGNLAIPVCIIGLSYNKNREILFNYFLISVPILCAILSNNGFESILGNILASMIQDKYRKIVYPISLIVIWLLYFFELYLGLRKQRKLDSKEESKYRHIALKSITEKEKKNKFEEQQDKKYPFKEKIQEKEESWLNKIFTKKPQNKYLSDEKTSQEQAYPKIIKSRVTNSSCLLPPMELLQPPTPAGTIDKRESQQIQDKLTTVLRDFNIGGELIGYSVGPVVTLHKLKLPSGIRASRVVSLSSDIARCIEVKSARISQIAGKDLLGIEVSNTNRRTINIREVFESSAFQNNKLPLLIGLGVGIGGEPDVASLAKMPHLLISGTTGSGKSVCMHSIIMSLLYKNTADDCRMILIDPKMLELSVYNNIPHLLTPVITEYNLAGPSLHWAVKEMDNRYRKIAEAGVRNLEEYNHTASEKLPYIVIVIDELADLISAIKGKEGKDFEMYLQRLAQKARAAGIHLVVATQRPSVDVVSGVIKANFPTRITFQLASEVDRRVIGEKQSGAEHLIGNGDMLYISPGMPIKRLQGPYISNTEVEKAVSWLGKNCEKKEHIIIEQQQSNCDYMDSDSDDPLYEEALKIAQEGRASISNLQRRLKIGFPRAGRIYEKLVENGVIQKENGR